MMFYKSISALPVFIQSFNASYAQSLSMFVTGFLFESQLLALRSLCVCACVDPCKGMDCQRTIDKGRLVGRQDGMAEGRIGAGRKEQGSNGGRRKQNVIAMGWGSVDQV